jgi:hypothetical protein
MQQRVVIAMALAKDPTVLILDEPTTGLDATVEAEVLDLIAALRQEFFNVAVGQAEAQVPADRNDDDIGWEAEAVERGARRDPLARWRVVLMVESLRRTTSRPTHQSPMTSSASNRVPIDGPVDRIGHGVGPVARPKVLESVGRWTLGAPRVGGILTPRQPSWSLGHRPGWWGSISWSCPWRSRSQAIDDDRAGP